MTRRRLGIAAATLGGALLGFGFYYFIGCHSS
jgi:hypothetical protein